jgi:hypothetical protein
MTEYEMRLISLNICFLSLLQKKKSGLQPVDGTSSRMEEEEKEEER